MAEILKQLKGRLVLLENYSLHCSSEPESTQARRVSESSLAHREAGHWQSLDDSPGAAEGGEGTEASQAPSPSGPGQSRCGQ
jgi:hypothetical protein